MAIVINNTVANYEDASTVPTPTLISGSNKFYGVFSMFSDNAPGGTLSTNSIGGTSLDNLGTLVSDGASSPYCKAGESYNLNGNYPSSGGTYDITISTAFLNSSSSILELTGVDQSSPITSGPDPKVLTSSSVFADHSIVMAAGDLLIYICSCTTANIISKPGDLGSDEFIESLSSSDIIGGSAQNGKVYTLIATEAHTETFAAGVTGTQTRFSACWVIKADTGGGSQSIVPLVIQQFLSQQQ